MPSHLEETKIFLLTIKKRPIIVNQTIASIEEYKKKNISKESLVKQLRTCLAQISEFKLLGVYPPIDQSNPYNLLGNLILGFERESSHVEQAKIDTREVRIENLTKRNSGKYVPYILESEEIFSEDLRTNAEKIGEMLKSSKPVLKVAFFGQEFVGYALGFCPSEEYIRGLWLEHKSYNPNLIYLETVVIVDKFQGRGLGKFLFGVFIEGAKQAGYKILEGHFRKEGSGSYHIFKKFGATDLKVYIDWFGSKEEYVYCRLDLTRV